MSFSSNKAPGHDNIAMSVIKDSLPRILPVLTDIVNWFLLSSVFPSHLNISEVTPARYLRKEVTRLQTITAQYHYSQLHRRFANE